MPVHCAQCGEELLGAVNRCWRCGAALVPQAGPAGIPPIRRAPVEAALDAAVVDDEASAASGDAPAQDRPPTDDRPPLTALPNDKADFRVDLSHATAAPRPAPVSGRVGTGTPASRASSSAPVPYRAQTAAVGGAVGAVALGALGIVGSFLFPVGGVITALLGLAMGLWGLFSRRRVVALVGILLCLIAFAIGAVVGGIQLYDAAFGHKPWEEAPEPDAWDEGF